jgi:hypothetical protein
LAALGDNVPAVVDSCLKDVNDFAKNIKSGAQTYAQVTNSSKYYDIYKQLVDNFGCKGGDVDTFLSQTLAYKNGIDNISN